MCHHGEKDEKSEAAQTHHSLCPESEN